MSCRDGDTSGADAAKMPCVAIPSAIHASSREDETKAIARNVFSESATWADFITLGNERC